MAITKCTKCYGPLRCGIEQVATDTNNNPIFHRFGYCDKCLFKYDLDDMDYRNSLKSGKKNSILGICALVFSFFSLTIFVSIILALIDLIRNDKTQKHVCSWIAIVLCIIFFLVT